MSEFGKVLIVIGLLFVGAGVLLWSGFGKGWFGRLPGDIHYSRDNFSFSFPIVTCLILSLIVSFLVWLFRR